MEGSGVVAARSGSSDKKRGGHGCTWKGVCGRQWRMRCGGLGEWWEVKIHQSRGRGWSRAGVMGLAELRRELLHASHVVLQQWGGCLAPLKRLLLACFACELTPTCARAPFFANSGTPLTPRSNKLAFLRSRAMLECKPGRSPTRRGGQGVEGGVELDC